MTIRDKRQRRMNPGLSAAIRSALSRTSTLETFPAAIPSALVGLGMSLVPITANAQGGVAHHVWQFRTRLTAGTGGFGQSNNSLGGSSSCIVSLGDVDGDGDLDAFVANTGPAN